MINKTIPFVGCTFHVVVQGKDYSGHVLGVVAVLTKDGDAYLIAPQTIRLFDSKQWEALTIEGAKRNSNNIDIWVEYADQVRAALFEDSEVQDALSNPSSQVHSTYKGSELVNLEEMKVVKLSNETKPGARKFLIENLIREDSIASLYGDSGHGKSHIAPPWGRALQLGSRS